MLLRFPRDVVESLVEKKELHDSVLGTESASDSFPESHSMDGNASDS